MKILIRGRPGVGKTTLVKTVVKKIAGSCSGFFTEELRHGTERVGFKIVTTDGTTGMLAHKDHPGPYRVAQYGVNIEDFERVAIPRLETVKSNWLVIDEIGKLELLSERFKKIVPGLFSQDSLSIIATIPVCRLPFIETLIKNHNPHVFELDLHNRERIAREVETLITTDSPIVTK